MNIRKYPRRYLMSVAAAAMVVALNSPFARAEESGGAIVGIVTNSAELPVAHATVTARRVDGGGIRATISGSDGVYSRPKSAWT